MSQAAEPIVTEYFLIEKDVDVQMRDGARRERDDGQQLCMLRICHALPARVCFRGEWLLGGRHSVPLVRASHASSSA
jgi:hypothetical protein